MEKYLIVPRNKSECVCNIETNWIIIKLIDLWLTFCLVIIKLDGFLVIFGDEYYLHYCCTQPQCSVFKCDIYETLKNTF